MLPTKAGVRVKCRSADACSMTLSTIFFLSSLDDIIFKLKILMLLSQEY